MSDHLSTRLQRSSTISRTDLPRDKESQSDDDFDLLDYLVRQLLPFSCGVTQFVPEFTSDVFPAFCSRQRGDFQQREAHGFRHKRLGVVFSDLTVKGMGGLRLTIRTFPDAIKELFLFPVIAVMMRVMKKTPKLILSGFNGFLRPGEMCFVLGRPNSGCSTFLKVVANQRIGFMGVDGDIEYGGIDASTMSKLYKGE